MVVKTKSKRKKGGKKARIYDTSVCQVKFRKPRILMKRKREFDPDRQLHFDPNRMIDARLQGVIFREGFAVGFRNIGVGNIEEVMEPNDWPNVGKARKPESLKIERDSDWDSTWGKDRSYLKKWGERPSRKKKKTKERGRIKPQVSDYQIVDQSKFAGGGGGSRGTSRKKTSSKLKKEKRRSSKVPTEKEKKRAYAFNEYALALMEDEKYQRAMDYFQKARDLHPSETTYKKNIKRCKEWLDYVKEKGGR